MKNKYVYEIRAYLVVLEILISVTCPRYTQLRTVTVSQMPCAQVYSILFLQIEFVSVGITVNSDVSERGYSPQNKRPMEESMCAKHAEICCTLQDLTFVGIVFQCFNWITFFLKEGI
jgi:hypothetical protein